MTDVLITGGSGFIGSRLALTCQNRGDRVRVLVQKNTQAERENCDELLSAGVQIQEGSVTDFDSVLSACDDVHTVYHLAAAQHEANVPDQHFYDVNVQGTRNLLTAANRCEVQRFVHGSTIGVYGRAGNGPVSDDSPLRPDNIYGVTKLEAEKVAHEYFDKLPIAIVRISETYGPGDRRLLKLFRGIQKKKLFYIGNGKNLHHLVYIDDLIDGLRFAATKQAAVGKTFVMAGAQATTTDEMIAGICKALGLKEPKLRVPLWPLMMAAVVMEKTLRPIGIQPPLHPRRMNFFVKSFRFQCNAARECVGYDPQVQFAEGACRTADWYKQMNLL